MRTNRGSTSGRPASLSRSSEPPRRPSAGPARLCRAALVALLLAAPLAGQEPAAPSPPAVQGARPLQLRPALRPPVADTGIFSPLPLPEPTAYRSASGAPGPEYWQQRVDYAIRATLDTAAERLAGTQRVRYLNRSPDTLRFLWLQLEQNLFRPGSKGSLLAPPDSRFGGAGFAGGFEIGRVEQVVREPPRRGRGARRSPRQVPLGTRVDDTMMYLELAAPLPPGDSAVVELDWAFRIPEHGADRMGREGSLYQIAQWYPRLAVYDDVHGWNTDPYLGQGEFYLEYGDVEYALTVPTGFIVAGTGILQNPAEVLTAEQRERLAAAARSDTAVRIVTGEELASGRARPAAEGTLTWRFRAENVRDAAWTASPEYQWDAAAWRGVLIQAYYRPLAAALWKDAVRMSRFSVEEYSRWFPYPYPQLSAVEGPVSGMGYPMLAMQARGSNAAELFSVLTHEIGHMWYPMTVGSDERRHAWMDEGLTTFIATLAEEGYWKRDDEAIRLSERRLVATLDQSAAAQPIMTPANRYRSIGLLTGLARLKPSVLLLALRDKVLGPAAFDAALREYTRRWAFKHPQPADFFRTVENVSGRDLAWFWRGFWYTTSALDQSVESVQPVADDSVEIALRSLGPAVMPVELELTFADGTRRLVRLPVEIWYGGDRYVHRLRSERPIVRARVNPDGGFPDAVPSNDAWTPPDSIPADSAR